MSFILRYYKPYFVKKQISGAEVSLLWHFYWSGMSLFVTLLLKSTGIMQLIALKTMLLVAQYQ